MSNALLSALAEHAAQRGCLVDGPPSQQIAVVRVFKHVACRSVVRDSERVPLQRKIQEGLRAGTGCRCRQREEREPDDGRRLLKAKGKV